MLSPQGDSPALGRPETPLTNGGEAAPRLRSSELGLSLWEETPAQAQATPGQTIHLSNRCPPASPLPETSPSGHLGQCLRRGVWESRTLSQGCPVLFPSPAVPHPQFCFSVSWFLKTHQPDLADGHLWRHGRASGCGWDRGDKRALCSQHTSRHSQLRHQGNTHTHRHLSPLVSEDTNI